MGVYKVFVSHSSKDKPLVDDFVDKILRLGCNVPLNEIYCSSKEGMKTRPGVAWIRDLKLKMQGAKVILLLLSPHYYDSVYCLAELGASWVLDDVQVFPILIPPLTVGNIEGVVQELQVGMIDSDEHLDNLRQMISEVIQTPIKNLPDWTRQRVTFVEQVNSLVALPPQKVSPDELRRALERVDVHKQERDEAQQEIERLKTYVEKLENLKDREEVGKIKLESLPENERFEALCAEIAGWFDTLPWIVRKIFYADTLGESYAVADAEEEKAARDAENQSFLKRAAYRKYRIADGRLDVHDTKVAIRDLADFLDKASNEFKTSYLNKHRYPPSIKNRDLWDRYIYQRFLSEWT